MMNLEYGLYCTIASSLGSLVGTILIQKIVRKTGRNSYLIFSLVVVLGISALLLPGQAVAEMVYDITRKGKTFSDIITFHPPC
jgi:hypothetical protein